MAVALGVENGAKYTIVGPDGTRITFNDQGDADHVGFLDGDNGVTGLDGAEVRENADDIVEGDGGIHGDFWLGRRPFTFTGIIDPTGGAVSIASKITKLRQAIARARRADVVVTYTTTGGNAVRLVARAQQPIRITNRYPKAFQIALVSADPLILSAAENAAAVLASAGGSGGFTSPLTSPLTSGASPSGQLTVTNNGTEDTYPRFTIVGPAVNPTILNATTGESMSFIYSLAAGEYLSIDTKNATVKLNGTADRDYAYDFLRSVWLRLVPGANDLRLLFSSFSTGAQMSVAWRDAWN